jgi:hypothetical protein
MVKLNYRTPESWDRIVSRLTSAVKLRGGPRCHSRDVLLVSIVTVQSAILITPDGIETNALCPMILMYCKIKAVSVLT